MKIFRKYLLIFLFPMLFFSLSFSQRTYRLGVAASSYETKMLEGSDEVGTFVGEGGEKFKQFVLWNLRVITRTSLNFIDGVKRGLIDRGWMFREVRDGEKIIEVCYIGLEEFNRKIGELLRQDTFYELPSAESFGDEPFSGNLSDGFSFGEPSGDDETFSYESAIDDMVLELEETIAFCICTIFEFEKKIAFMRTIIDERSYLNFEVRDKILENINELRGKLFKSRMELVELKKQLVGSSEQLFESKKRFLYLRILEFKLTNQ